MSVKRSGWRATCALAGLTLVVPADLCAQRLEAQPFITGFSNPLAFVSPPGTSGLHFVVEQRGLIRVISGGVLRSTPFLDLSGDLAPGFEQGLLGLAFDPSYVTNGRFYVLFTRLGSAAGESGDIVVARFNRSSSNPLVTDATTRFDLQWGPGGPRFIEHSAFANHNGGTLMFGPDGYLYISLGDGGGNDPDNSGQNPNSLLGKMLRIDVNVPDGNLQGYQVPPDNPFVDDNPIDALPEIWDFGLRNPWKFSFDDPSRGGTGALIIGDVGGVAREEVDYEPAGQGGRNYGWRNREGTQPGPGPGEGYPALTPPAFMPLTDPAIEYAHTTGVSLLEGQSITGGYVYRGADLSAFWRGRYFFADWAHGRVWSAGIFPTTGSIIPGTIIDHTSIFGTGSVSSFGVDNRGELYIVSHSAGTVYRLCEFTIAPGVTSFAANGGSGTVGVTTTPACGFNVTPNVPWVTLITNSQETGTKQVIFRVLPNTSGSPRTAVLTMAGHQVMIAQSAAPPTLGDIDGNRSADLFWQHTDGRLAAWLMQGTSLMDGRPLSNWLGPVVLSDPRWRLAATSDFDGDGSRDILFQHSNGSLGMWFMSGTTLLMGGLLIPSAVQDTNWIVRGGGDMNGDGFADIVWQNQITGQVAVWFMDRNRQLGGQLLTPGSVSDVNWHIVGTGDFNGDGKTDLAWQHQTNGLIAVWLMDGTVMTSGILFSPSGVSDTNWKVRAIGDANGDGWPDLFWQNQSTGLLAVWLMNGATRVGDGLRLNPEEVTDTGWRIVGPR